MFYELSKHRSQMDTSTQSYGRFEIANILTLLRVNPVQYKRGTRSSTSGIHCDMNYVSVLLSRACPHENERFSRTIRPPIQPISTCRSMFRTATSWTGVSLAQTEQSTKGGTSWNDSCPAWLMFLFYLSGAKMKLEIQQRYGVGLPPPPPPGCP